jgi:hypothetical protein
MFPFDIRLSASISGQEVGIFRAENGFQLQERLLPTTYNSQLASDLPMTKPAQQSTCSQKNATKFASI